MLVAGAVFGVAIDHAVALAKQTRDGTILSLTPVLHRERVVTGAGGKLGVVERPALLERQVDEVGFRQARTIRTLAVADEGRQFGVDVEVDDGFAHALSLVVVGRNDDLVEDRVEPTLTNLVLLSLAIADGHRDDEEVVVRTSENRGGVREQLRLTEERRVADVFADQGNLTTATQLLLLAESSVCGDHRVGETFAFEPVRVSAAEVDFAKSGDGVLLVEAEHGHEKTEALDGAVEVGLALEDRSVNVDEERSHLAVAGAEIASGHTAFGGHNDLPLDTRHVEVQAGLFHSAPVKRRSTSS